MSSRSPLRPRRPLRASATPAPQPPPESSDGASTVGGSGPGWPVGMKAEPMGTTAAAATTTRSAPSRPAAPGPPRASTLPTGTAGATLTPAPSSTSWPAWLAHFVAMDALAQLSSVAGETRDTAAEEEDFTVAAAAHATTVRLARRDTVREVGIELFEAIAAEDYAAAAALRDAGGAGLVGWWASAPTPADPAGHLLRVAPRYGMYEGSLFRASDIAEAAGWGDFGKGGSSSSGSPSPTGSEDEEEDEGEEEEEDSDLDEGYPTQWLSTFGEAALQVQERVAGPSAFDDVGHPVLEWYVRDRRPEAVADEEASIPSSPSSRAAFIAALEARAVVLPAPAAFNIFIEDADDEADSEDDEEAESEEDDARSVRATTRGRRRRRQVFGRPLSPEAIEALKEKGEAEGGGDEAEAADAAAARVFATAKTDASDEGDDDNDDDDDDDDDDDVDEKFGSLGGATAGRREDGGRRGGGGPNRHLVMFAVASNPLLPDEEEVDDDAGVEASGAGAMGCWMSTRSAPPRLSGAARNAALASVAGSLLAGSAVEAAAAAGLGLGLGQQPTTRARAPAAVSWHSPDRFTLSVDAPPAPSPPVVDTVTAPADGAAVAAGPAPEFAVVASAVCLARLADNDAAFKWDETGEASPRSLSAIRLGAGRPYLDNEAEGDDGLVRASAIVARAAAKASRAAGRATPAASPAEVADVVRGAVAAALGPRADVTVDVAPSAPCLTGSTTYDRLDPVALTRPADPYCGLYLAAFGSNGPELILVRRETPAERAAAATAKWVAGRPSPAAKAKKGSVPGRGQSVPAPAETVVGVRLASDVGGREPGIVFRATLGREGSRPPGDAYPAELGVRRRYRAVGYMHRPDPAGWGGLDEEDEDDFFGGRRSSGGGGDGGRRGRAGRAGRLGGSASGRSRSASRSASLPPRKRHPVPGELIEFSGVSPLVRGAGLGFVWIAPGERGGQRHLVLLTRVPLDDVAGDARTQAACKRGFSG